ncbi:hypothetical protein OH76DRAFT_1410537 [Lentinus brumalis]|uniref:F-box domain-containing protein n=1 Tax=Lentinus brumalis TaxID=2498619 RepID=A0A371CRT6_9APHY|nr:hypothetical protein OH76DRAFT_1410537 [Polyporus brumalis]
MQQIKIKFLDLNDDVLVHVFSYLHGKDALFVALSSRRLHSLAINRVSTVVKCESLEKLARLQSWILATSPSRAGHVIDLEFDLPNTIPALFKAKIAIPLTELLMHTCNVRHMVLHRGFITNVTTEVSHAIGGALRAMPRLTELSMDHVHDGFLSTIGSSLPPSLRKLSLAYILQWHWNEWHHSYAPLIQILASLPRLHTLAIHRFEPEKLWTPDAPLFPSLLHLTLHEVSLPAVDLVSLTPNVRQVSVTYQPHRHTWSLPPPEPWTEPPRSWPPVRRLEFNVMSSLSHFLDAISETADYLKITARTPPSRAGDLISTFRTISPVGADLYLTVGKNPIAFWRELFDNAPRLRYLRLSLTVKSSGDADDFVTPWLDELVASFEALPLVYLKVRPHLKFDKATLNKGTGKTAKRRAEAQLDQERQLTQEVVSEMAASLPQRLADAMPTLSFFELGIPGECIEYGVPYARGEDADTSRWWRIVSGDRGREPREISAGDGQRVLDFLEDAETNDDLNHLERLVPRD